MTRFLALGVTWVALGWCCGGLIAATMHGRPAHVALFAVLTGISGAYLWLLAGQR